jgi:hypothetical protein
MNEGEGKFNPEAEDAKHWEDLKHYFEDDRDRALNHQEGDGVAFYRKGADNFAKLMEAYLEKATSRDFFTPAEVEGEKESNLYKSLTLGSLPQTT